MNNNTSHTAVKPANINSTNSAEAFFEAISNNFRRYQLIPLSVIFAIGLIANSMVIFNGIRRRKIIKHYSNYFVLSTAFADWMALFVTIPFMYVEYLVGFAWMSEFICKYILQIRETFQGAAVFSVATLAFLRVRQVMKNPLGEFSKRTCRRLVAGIWLISFLICTVPSFDIYTITPAGFCDPIWPTLLRMKIQVSFICFIIISPIVAATVSYGIVIFKISSFLGSDPESERQTNRNRSITVLLVMLILSCWISYTPLSVFFVIRIYTNIKTSAATWHVVTMLYLGGSTLNPLFVLLTMPKDYRFDVQCKRRIGVEQPNAAHKQVLQSSVPLQDRNVVIY